jgi:hypothetical protein
MKRKGLSFSGCKKSTRICKRVRKDMKRKGIGDGERQEGGSKRTSGLKDIPLFFVSVAFKGL